MADWSFIDFVSIRKGETSSCIEFEGEVDGDDNEDTMIYFCINPLKKTYNETNMNENQLRIWTAMLVTKSLKVRVPINFFNNYNLLKKNYGNSLLIVFIWYDKVQNLLNKRKKYPISDIIDKISINNDSGKRLNVVIIAMNDNLFQRKKKI